MFAQIDMSLFFSGMRDGLLWQSAWLVLLWCLKEGDKEALEAGAEAPKATALHFHPREASTEDTGMVLLQWQLKKEFFFCNLEVLLLAWETKFSLKLLRFWNLAALVSFCNNSCDAERNSGSLVVGCTFQLRPFVLGLAANWRLNGRF
jgi:hypothetical protein